MKRSHQKNCSCKKINVLLETKGQMGGKQNQVLKKKSDKKQKTNQFPKISTFGLNRQKRLKKAHQENRN